MSSRAGCGFGNSKETGQARNVWELMKAPEVADVPISALDPCHLDANVRRCLIGKQGFKGLLGSAPKAPGPVNV